jgi:hypothetical protein
MKKMKKRYMKMKKEMEHRLITYLKELYDKKEVIRKMPEMKKQDSYEAGYQRLINSG